MLAILTLTNPADGRVLFERSDDRLLEETLIDEFRHLGLREKYSRLCHGGMPYYCFMPDGISAFIYFEFNDSAKFGFPLQQETRDRFDDIRIAGESRVLYAYWHMKELEKYYPDTVSALLAGGGAGNLSKMNTRIVQAAVNGWLSRQCTASAALIGEADRLAGSGVFTILSTTYRNSSNGCATVYEGTGVSGSLGAWDVDNLDCEISTLEFARCEFTTNLGARFNTGDSSLDSFVSGMMTRRVVMRAEFVYVPNGGWRLLGLL